jgi:hypothetical protein
VPTPLGLESEKLHVEPPSASLNLFNGFHAARCETEGMSDPYANAPATICLLATSVVATATQYAARPPPPRWPRRLVADDSEAFLRSCEETAFFSDHPAPGPIVRAHLDAIAVEHARAHAGFGARVRAEELARRLPALHTAAAARDARPPPDGDWTRATPTAAHARAAYDFAATMIDPQAGAAALLATLVALPQ